MAGEKIKSISISAAIAFALTVGADLLLQPRTVYPDYWVLMLAILYAIFLAAAHGVIWLVKRRSS